MRRNAVLAFALVAVCSNGATLNRPTASAASSPTPGSPSAPTLLAPCGVTPAPPQAWGHVIWIWMENTSYVQIVGTAEAPYINSLIEQCGLATNYHNITHPSLPNYIAATSGLGYAQLVPFGSDCSPSLLCSTTARSIFDQTGWKAYQESMPSNCLDHNSGQYVVRHNPPPYYRRLAGCATYDVPIGRLQADLQANTLPSFSFVTPNVCHDMHDCSISNGDTWLSQLIPAILESPGYQEGSTAVFLTWDEGAGSFPPTCAGNTTSESCHVVTVVISPTTTAGTEAGPLFNHWSLLRTTEEMLGIGEFLGHAAESTSMRLPFNL